MIKRIDLFVPTRSRYEALNYFTNCLYQSFLRNGIQARLLDVQNRDPKPFIDQILENPPDFTFSFNGVLPDEHGNFLCDVLKIPHVCFLVDSPHYYLLLIRSERNIITSVDRFGADFFKRLNFQNCFFIPHGVDINLFDRSPSPSSKRPYDVTMLSSFTDFEEIEAIWREKYDKPFVEALEDAVGIALKNPEIPYAQALSQAFDTYSKKQGGIDPKKFDFITLLTEIENYIRGKDRFELIRSIKDAKVHLFGEGSQKWKALLKNPSNVIAYDSIPYMESIAVMQQSKIVLNSSPFFKYGSHERVFTGIAAGAFVLTNYNLYFNECFKDGESIGFYYPTQWHNVNAVINDYLSDSKKRVSIVEKGQEIVKNHHTWDNRARTLIKDIEPIINHI